MFLGWGNRCTACAPSQSWNFGGYPIQVDGELKGWQFTTKRRSDACTLAQFQVMVGDNTAATGIAKFAGLTTLYKGSDPKAALDEAGEFVDVCNLDLPTIQGADIIALDWEVCDGHTPAELQMLGSALKNLANRRGWKTLLYSSGIIAPCAGDSGIAPGAWVLDVFDYVTIIAATADASDYAGTWNNLAYQLGVIDPAPGQYDRILVDTDGSGSSGLLRAAGDYARQKGLGGWILWPGGTADPAYYPNAALCLTQGTNCPN